MEAAHDLPAFEDVVHRLREGELRNLLQPDGRYIGKVALVHGLYYVAGPRVLRQISMMLILTTGTDVFNRGEKSHLRHVYECGTPEEAVAIYEGLLAYEE